MASFFFLHINNVVNFSFIFPKIVSFVFAKLFGLVHGELCSIGCLKGNGGQNSSLTTTSGSGYNSGTQLITQAENNFTVELWVNPTSTHQIDTEGDNFGGIAGQKFAIDALDPMQVGNMDLTTAGMGISVGTNGVSVYEHGYNYMPPLLVWEGSVSGWTHIAVVYEGGQPSLYVNGEFKKSGLTSPKAHVHPGNLVASGYYGTMDGQIDEVRVWNY